MSDVLRRKLPSLFVFGLVFCLCGAVAHADDKLLPEIIASPTNAVPDCVKPDWLMAHVERHNRLHDPPQTFDPRFSHIASVYKSIGECVQRVDGKCVGVRWDYAFFQMLIETDYLAFPGRVKADSFNFAGIGAMTADSLGDRFASIHDGVLAHLQHVAMYAGVPITHPVYARTTIIAADVREVFSALGRPVTFSDLAKMWTGTHQLTYGDQIERASDHYRKEYCQK
jgi:hypothetical protein